MLKHFPAGQPNDLSDDSVLIDDDLAPALKALSGPNRLRIFNILMEGVQCNCEISERLGMSLSLISYHVRILSEAGLVQSERDAQDTRWVYYSVDRDALKRLMRQLTYLLDAGRIQPRVPSCGPRHCCQCGE